MFDDEELQNVLLSWPKIEISEEPLNDSLLDRIRQILVQAQSSNAETQFKGDLLPLLRQYLIRETEKRHQLFPLRFPPNSVWHTARDWENHGMSALSIQDQTVIIKPEEWYPSWLDHNSQGVFADAFKDIKVREDGCCNADPFFSHATGYAEYFCPGQREAIRSTFLMKAGHTLVVDLPTGSGKSLVGQIPALVHKQDGNLVIFVVPTIALAIDQERQIRRFLSKEHKLEKQWPLAWHGGLSGEHRREVRDRMRKGTQRILFTSPESLVTSLLRDVFEVAQLGMLTYLVIDEAHLVTQWGDEFRPAFQALAGVRNALLRQCQDHPFRTLVMSATFTKDTVESLACLFGPREKVHVVSAVHLRPEPQYWFHEAFSNDDKKTKVSEALRYAPRPFILYVTKPEDAEGWLEFLKSEHGLNRISCFHGKTSFEQREIIIQNWAANKLDGIVATSAFGVGIDKNDVRTIIHAAIPENLDRFYQEVGRGGRDGRPSVSLLVFEKSDWYDANVLAKRRIIGPDIGFERWRAIYSSRQSTNDTDLVKIDIEAVRNGLSKSSEFNVDWNMRTLLLMSRANMIQLDVEPTDEDCDKENEGNSSPSILSIMASIRIRILNEGHMIDEEWNRITESCRNISLEADANNLSLMKKILNGDSEVSEILADLYKIRSDSWFVDVARVCGGCHKDRTEPLEERSYRVPIAFPIQDVTPSDFTEWTGKFPWLSADQAFIFFDDSKKSSENADKIIMILEWLVSKCHIHEICADRYRHLADLNRFEKLFNASPTGFLIHRSISQIDEEPYALLSRATILYGDKVEHDLTLLRNINRRHHIIFLPERTRDPGHDGRFFVHVVPNSISLQDFYEAVRER